MPTKRTRRTRAAATVAQNLMLAPAVVAMRMPLLAMEAREHNPWRVETIRAVTEKTAAAMEGAVAAQMSLAYSASRFWLEVMSGRTPSILSGAALERALHAALEPSGKTVKTNHARLSRL